MESFLMERSTMKLAADPVNGQATAITGARVSMAKGDRVSFILLMGAGTGSTVNPSFQQHNAASGGTSKALLMGNPYYVKAGTAQVYTKVTPGAPASNFDISTLFAADGGIAVFEVLAEELDVNANFTHVSINTPVTGTAKVIAAFYVVSKTKDRPAYLTAI